MLRLLAVALLTPVLAACGGSDLPDPPAGYVTFAMEGVEFSHPPGWRAERPAAQPGVRFSAVLRPAGANPDKPGPVIDVRVTELEGSLAGAAAALRRRGSPAEQEELELEVPGAQEAVALTSSGALESAVALARFGATGVVRLTVTEPASSRAIDGRAVIGSLRLSPTP